MARSVSSLHLGLAIGPQLHLELSHRQHVAVAQPNLSVDPFTIDKCAVARAEISQPPAALSVSELGMSCRNELILKHNRVIGAAPYCRRSVDGKRVARAVRCRAAVDDDQLRSRSRVFRISGCGSMQVLPDHCYRLPQKQVQHDEKRESQDEDDAFARQSDGSLFLMISDAEDEVRLAKGEFVTVREDMPGYSPPAGEGAVGAAAICENEPPGLPGDSRVVA